MSSFEDLEIIELRLLADLSRCRSLRSWAQGRRLSIVKATRLLQQLERKLDVKLATRTTQGVACTAAGHRLSTAAQDALSAIDRLKHHVADVSMPGWASELTIASRSFLNTFIAGSVVQSVAAHGSRIGLRFIDVSPEEAIFTAKSGTIDLVIAFEDVAVGRNWQTESIGLLEWRVYGKAGHPLSGGASAAQLGNYLIGRHVFWDGEKLVLSQGMLFDSLQVPHFGYAAQTAATAAAIAAHSDQLICIPTVVAADLVRLGRLCEIAVQELKPLQVPLHLWTNVDTVPSPIQRRIRANLAELLKKAR